MANYNKVILAGNLTRAPELAYLPSNTPIVKFGLAINRKWTGQDGKKTEEVCFVDCVIYGKSAETLNQYVTKGSPLLVEGRLKLDTWQAKDGQKRSKHEVVVEKFQFLGKAELPDASGEAAPPKQAKYAAKASGPAEFPQDEIPF